VPNIIPHHLNPCCGCVSIVCIVCRSYAYDRYILYVDLRRVVCSPKGQSRHEHDRWIQEISSFEKGFHPQSIHTFFRAIHCTLHRCTYLSMQIADGMEP
jgi:hypothetical protein